MRTIRHLLVFAVVVTLSPPSVVCTQNFYAAVRGGPGWTPTVADQGPIARSRAVA
jgi:hypothetical protein